MNEINEIKNEPVGRKLDARIAEQIFESKGIFNVGDQWFTDDNIKNKLPLYSSDISSAWHILERVQTEWSWDMQMINLAGEIDVRIGNGYATSTSLSEAICKAALINHFNHCYYNN